MPTKTLGPWPGGLNLKANRGLSVFLSDNELGDAENVSITDEGFLVPRPGCKVLLDNRPTGLYQHANSAALYLVGNVTYSNGTVIAIVEVIEGATTYIYKVLDDNNATLLFTMTTGRATSLVVHSGFSSALTGSYTYPIDTGVLIFTNSPTEPLFILPLDLNVTIAPTPVSPTYNIPPSNYSMVVKDRLFLFDYTKNIMWWSPATYILDFRTDLATIDVAPFGNDTAGQEIIEPGITSDQIKSVEFYNNNFYIFKRKNTFMFTYQLSPLTDGYMRKISNDMGAIDSTIFQEKIIVVNDSGVFRLENTEFIDLQAKMNFNFELPLSLSNLNAFITILNNNILIGFSDMNIFGSAASRWYYYYMNTITGAWSKWSYDYIDTDKYLRPKPFGNGYGKPIVFCNAGSIGTTPKLLFVDILSQKFLYMSLAPSGPNYHLDSNTISSSSYDKFYIPNVTIKTTASVGNSMLNHKKLYRYYTRFYLSEVPALIADGPVWTISVNYDSYTFDNTKNPIFGLYPVENPLLYPDPHATVLTVNYFRAYQLKIPQQRAKEFVFELKRKGTSIDSTTVLVNPDADREIKKGYYFMLTGIWFDYQDKALI
jgi:hypothetical protein